MRKLLCVPLCLMMITFLGGQLCAQELIASVDSRDSADDDADEVYLVGTQVDIIVTALDNRDDLSGTISISSATTGYNSGIRTLDNNADGTYQYTWDTSGLSPAKDYRVSVSLNESTDESMIIELYNPDLLLENVDSQDNVNPDDNDEIYHSGQLIKIIVEYPTRLRLQPTGTLEIGSSIGRSQTGTLQNGPANTLEYIWNTAGLGEADDYVVSVTLRDNAGHKVTDNSLVIKIDNTPPGISTVTSHDRDDITDDNAIYHAGQTVVIDIQVVDRESRLEAEISIKSDAVSYDLGSPSARSRLTDQGDGLWRFLWTTTGLNPAKDYVATVSFRDEAALESQDSSLRMEIDNTPPQNGKVLITGEALDDVYTISRSVKLTLSADGATRMYLSGDVVDDVSTFEWIPYAESLGVKLIHRDGSKRVSVRFMDDASNESPSVEDTIILDEQPPVITSVGSHDDTDTLDDDNIYHADQLITIVVETEEEGLVELEGILSITSASANYDSGSQTLDSVGPASASYAYTWNTSGLLEAGDYIVSVNLKDPSNREVSDASLRITIDNTPPSGGAIKINDGQTDTDSRSVTLTLSASGEPREMFIDGDLVDDTNTFQWITYISRIVVNLTDADGQKEVGVKFRDAARNIGGITTATISLDRQAPTSTSIIIEDGAENTLTRDVTLTLQAVNAKQMLIDGDIVDVGSPTTRTFDWIDYSSTVSLKLSPGDGEKRVGVVFRNKVGILSDRIEDSIFLDTSEPVVKVVDSWDSSDPQDDDEIFHPGQSIIISVTVEAGEHKVHPYIRIRSATTAYDTGEQEMSGERTGVSFTYLWDTTALQEADDYTAFIELTDAAGHKTQINLIITIDSLPPTRGQVSINDGDETADSRTVRLKVSAVDAVSMFVSGDLVEDSNTFQWISYRTGMTANLSGADGQKDINVKFRDAAGNESADVSGSITLDRKSPYDPEVIIATSSEGADAGIPDEFATSRQVFLALSVRNAVEMYISGNVQASPSAPNTFEWIPHSPQLTVELTEGDGEKVVYAKFRNQRGIESEQIESRITLDTSPPDILSLTYRDALDPDDNDGWYHPGESIRITVEATEASEPEVEITIKSEITGYDSGVQAPDFTRTAGGSWRLEYVWNTTDLDDGSDYTIEVTLTDAAGWVVTSAPEILVLDSSPPTNIKVSINKGAKRTASRMVTLEASADNAVEMFVAGDVRDSGNTFRWIPTKKTMTIILSSTEGVKNVEVKFRNMAENETDTEIATVILSQTPPVIEKVDSWDTADFNNDEQYHAGELIKIALKAQARDDAPMIETDLLGRVSVVSSDTGYDSGEQDARDDKELASGWYTYTWDTTGLAEGTYQVAWNLSDGVGNAVSDHSLSISIDNTPPKNPQISINTGFASEYTRYRSINLNLQATDASWVFIDGEILNDEKTTFRWRPFFLAVGDPTMKITVRLAGSDGMKRVQAKFKDDADNTTDVVSAKIILDTVGPNAISVAINDDAEYTSLTEIDLTIAALGSPSAKQSNLGSPSAKQSNDDAVEMYIDGDIIAQASPTVRQWVPYQEKVSLTLTDEDGDKTVDVEFKDAAGNYSDKISDTIILDSSPPEIDSVKSANSEAPADDDGRYLEGTQVNITIDAGEAELSATIMISSSASGYASGVQNMEDVGDGTYTYSWDTSFLQVADDYTTVIELTDKAGNSTVDDSLIMAIFREPIEQEISINDDESVTTSQSVQVTISADNAVEIYISGDVVDDSNTFEWIPMETRGLTVSPRRRVAVSLLPGDGVKNITVAFRDSLEREIGTSEASIRLDQKPPVIVDVSADRDGDSSASSTYRAEGTVNITIFNQESGLDGSIHVRSLSTGYDSGTQRATAGAAGEYSYPWDVTGLKEGLDYRVEAILSDEAGWTAKDYSLTIAIDNTPPEGGEITINAGGLFTQNRSVELAFAPAQASDAVEMSIEGDIVDDSNTFEWIPFSLAPTSASFSLILNLTVGDGEKRVIVNFRDEAGNETEPIEKLIVLNELPPVITAVDSEAVAGEDDPTDDDEIYHAGQVVEITIAVDEPMPSASFSSLAPPLPHLEAWVQIASLESGYDSGLLTATREGDAPTEPFSVIWNTYSVPEAPDYIVEATLQDNYGQKTVDNSLTISIDNTPPIVSGVSIDDGKEVSNSQNVMLTVELASERQSLLDATEMFIDGDVAEFNTFRWIQFSSQSATRQIELSEGDGTKTVTVKVRDSAGNISEPASATISLDRSVPSAPNISINDGAEYTESHKITLQLSAASAREMYISGNVVRNEDTFRWVPFENSYSVRLTEGEGDKTVRAIFRNGVDNDSDEVDAQIVLDFSPPIIASIQAFDVSDRDDNDLSFHSGQEILLEATGEESGLEGWVHIKSVISDQSSVIITDHSSLITVYDSGRQSMSDMGGGRYTFLWNSDGIADGNYSCEFTLEDMAEHSATDSIEIVLDNQGPHNPSITISPSAHEPASLSFAYSRTIEVNLSADGDPTEVFIAGDVADDDRTFEWIPFPGASSSLSLNLRGTDGDKKVTATFRDKARSESSMAETNISLELKRPELAESCRIIQVEQAVGAELDPVLKAYLALQFDEPINKLEPKDFFLVLRDKANLNAVYLDGTSSELILSNDVVMLEIPTEQLDEIKQWQPMTLATGNTSYIQAEIAENGVLDAADKGNLSSESDPADVYFVAPTSSIQVDVTPISFSPNDDEVKDKTVITYLPARTSDVTIKIRNAQRETVREWQVEDQTGGLVYTVEWNGKKEKSPYPDGQYTVIIMGSEVEATGFAYGLMQDFTIDNSIPQIADIRPWEGAEVPILFRASINVVDTPITKYSGIEAVYITVDGDIENEFPLAKSETEGEYVVPTISELLLPPGKHDVSYHVVDMAGNETEKTVSYTTVAEIEPLLYIMNFPNPFPPGDTTTVRYSLPEDARKGKVAIYDAGGDIVLYKDLAAEELARGEHTFRWDGVDMFGRILARGIYFCRLWVDAETGDKSEIHKIAIR